MRVSRRVLIAGGSAAVGLRVLIVGFFVLTSRKPAIIPTAKPEPTISPSRPKLLSPFTGEPIASVGPELIFKIDNIQQARPPTNLTKADIVYILPVDGGLSRIFALFSSRIPRLVGPVRSARAEDIELLRQFGRPAFAFSGAQAFLLPGVEHARIVDLYAGMVGGYFRDYNRIAPYNLYALTKVLRKEAKGASKARDIGVRFGPAPPA